VRVTVIHTLEGLVLWRHIMLVQLALMTHRAFCFSPLRSFPSVGWRPSVCCTNVLALARGLLPDTSDPCADATSSGGACSFRDDGFSSMSSALKFSLDCRATERHR
jgi:hypothetical protein